MNAASVAESALMTLLMLAKRVREQHTTFQQRGLGRPLGMQLAGKTLGIVGMGAIGPHCALRTIMLSHWNTFEVCPHIATLVCMFAKCSFSAPRPGNRFIAVA